MKTLREKFAGRRLETAIAMFVAASSCAGMAQNIRGAATGPTTAKGYDHPGQYIHLQDVKPADNMYPVILHPEQDAEARKKLAALEQKTGKKPNILIFLMDDVGWMDPGFNGGGEAVGNATPVMDRLANAGLIFTSAYSTPSSSPSRATIMTGQNPLHHGILIPAMYGHPGGLDGAITVASLLKKQGYVTQGVGKWHIGENQPSLPQNVGFDDYVGFLSVSDQYTEWRDEYYNPEVALSPGRFSMMENDPFSHNEVHCTPANKSNCEMGKLIDLTYIKDLDQHWLDTSLAFLDKMKGSQQPFFLYHATRGCHFDNYPSDEWAGKSMSRTSYGDCMVQMDYILGQLYDKLQQIGELDNTLIILSSDNGPECEVPPHARTPFRGCKGSSWEGGVRVPTFAYWKGMINPRKDDGLFDFADILPTAMSLAGVPGAKLADLFPKTTYIDGVDQASWIVADEGHSARRSRIYTLNQYFSAVRIDEFKYIVTAEIENGMFQKGDLGGFSGSIVTDTGGAIMINLYTDPQEDVNVGIRHIPMITLLGQAVGVYVRDLLKYPPQFKIGFFSNNPPLYILAPQMKNMNQGALEMKDKAGADKPTP
ncbi:MAG: sulfatase-like hydrolase/transferase [Candidatus Korobacteraceae bacterium]